MNKIIIFLAFFLMISCGKNETTVIDDYFYRDLRWDSASFPITIQVPEEYESDSMYIDAFENSINAWNSALGFTAFNLNYLGDDVSKGKSAPYNIDDFLYDGLFSLIFPSEWLNNTNENVLAKTAILYQDKKKRIIHADIIFNKKKYNFSLEENTPSNQIDFESVLTHELGHFLGLEHVCQTENERKTKGKCESKSDETSLSYTNYNTCTSNNGNWISECIGNINDSESLDADSIMNMSITFGQQKRILSPKDKTKIQERYK